MKKLILTAALLLFTGATFAQFQFSVHLGGSIPTRDFGQTAIYNGALVGSILFDEGRDGNAGVGFNIGAKGKFFLPDEEGLGIIVTIDGFYNGLNGDAEDFFEVEKYKAEQLDITRPRHINIPIMLGFNYQMDFGDMVGIWVEAAAGPNVRMITDMVVSGSGYDYDYNSSYRYSYKYDYKPSVCFSYQLGVGAMIASHISLGVHYYGSGYQNVSYTYSWDRWGLYYDASSGSVTASSSHKKFKTGMWVLRLGYHF